MKDEAKNNIPKDRKPKKSKWLTKMAIDIADKRREAKKGQAHPEEVRKLNAECQRQARKDKGDYLNKACKEIEDVTSSMPKYLDKMDLAKTMEGVSLCTNTKKGDSSICSNNRTIALISHASKVMLKVIQHRLNIYMEQEMAIEQAGFTKGRGTRDHISNLRWIMERSTEYQRPIYMCFID